MRYEEAGQDIMEYIWGAGLIRGAQLANGIAIEGAVKPLWSANAAEQIGELLRSIINKGLEDSE